MIAAAMLAALPWAVNAQVEKQVEVTKAYVPSVESASKLAAVPDMTDTTRMRPEIDYTITPLSLATALEMRPIRPAQVTYWEFNRPLPFYLKAGAGYPLNSVFDFYASTQNAGTGYVLGYVNHEGRYADIANEFGAKHNAVRMTNRIGAAGGKYLGRRLLEIAFGYENRMYHRYGSQSVGERIAGGSEEALPAASDDCLDYGEFSAGIRYGDDFQDLSRTNFEIALGGYAFFDHSDAPDYGNKARQTALDVSGKIARGWGRSRFSLDVGYRRIGGQKAIDDYLQQMIRAGARFGYEGGFIRFDAGVDYYHDKVKGAESENYLIPYARIDFNLGTEGLKPFVEIDGGVADNSYRSLTLRNPYVANPWTLGKSSVDYDGRFGIVGSLFRKRFSYRVYAGFSIRDNHLYWTSFREPFPAADGTEGMLLWGVFVPVTARQTVTSINGEIDYRPVSSLILSLGVHGNIYNDDTSLENGAASFTGNAGIRYEGRKIAFGVSARMQSVRKWTTWAVDSADPEARTATVFEAPFGVDLRLNFDWKVSSRVTLFAEGRNLADRKLYDYAWYPEYGANFTMGIKANF